MMQHKKTQALGCLGLQVYLGGTEGHPPGNETNGSSIRPAPRSGWMCDVGYFPPNTPAG